jgi:regulatory protein
MTACIRRLSAVAGKDTVVVHSEAGRWEIASAAAAELQLAPGVVVTPEMQARLEAAERRRAAAARALRGLRRRPRTESEVRADLERAGFAPDIASGVLAELRRQGLVDDARWARWFVEARLAHRPQGAAALVREMRARGVAPALAASAVAGAAVGSESQRALAAARKRLASLRGLPRERAAGRLARFLAGRGFGADTVNAVCAELLGVDADESGP